MRSRQLLSAEELTEALTYTKLLPGSTVVQVVAYLGHRLRGWLGSAAATTMFLLPSAALMLALAALYTRGVAIPTVSRALHGVTDAAAATLGVFLMPWVLAGVAAAQLSRCAKSPWLKRFGYGAAPPVIGLLGVMTWSLGRTAIMSWIDAAVALAALGLVLRTRIHPLVVIAAGAVIGALTVD